MTFIIHQVGNGDIGVDILPFRDKNVRDAFSKKRREELSRLLAQADSEGTERIAAALFALEYPRSEYSAAGCPDATQDKRFSCSPLATIFRALSRECNREGQLTSVTLLLLGSGEGDQKSQTAPISELLHKAFTLDGVRQAVQRDFRLDLKVEELPDGAKLKEGSGREALTQQLKQLLGDRRHEDVIVNGISGPTMAMMGILGIVDQLGLRWRLAVAPQPGGDTATFVSRDAQDPVTPFKWLRSLGYVTEAQEWARSHERADLVDTDLCVFVEATKAVSESGTNATAKDFGRVTLLEMLRADNDAAGTLRAWIQKHYEELLENGQASLFSGTRPRQLGQAIGEAENQVAKEGENAPESTRWLARQKRLNEAGKVAVHEGAAPSAADIKAVLKTEELNMLRPEWLTVPGERPLLFIHAVGKHCTHPSIGERVLSRPPARTLRQGMPGGLLRETPPLPVEFLVLHSDEPDSKSAAMEESASILHVRKHREWDIPGHVPVDIVDYGGNEFTEVTGAALTLESVATRVRLALEVKNPAAIVLSATGQKGAVIGALREVKRWGTKHAVPVYLQTYVNREEGVDDELQFHRIALGDSAEQALMTAARASLKSFNLRSAVRVLSAGDQDMDDLASACHDLVVDYEKARTATEPDQHLHTIIDVLKVIEELLNESSHVEASSHVSLCLAVVAAEITGSTRHAKVLRRNKGLKGEEERKRIKGKEIICLDLPDLLGVLYLARNKLVLTHGGHTAVDKALKEICEDLDLQRPESFGYRKLLQIVIDTIERVARNEGVAIKSEGAWKARFDRLVDRVTAGAEGHTVPDVVPTNMLLHLVNLSPHEVTIVTEESGAITFPASATTPRLEFGCGRTTEIDVAAPGQGPVSLPLVVGERLLDLNPPLPCPSPGVGYIVSRMVAQAYPERTDLYWPDGLLRDEDGQVVGARRLATMASPTQEADCTK